MTKEAFYYWLENVFISSLPPAAERGPVVLLLDGHSSHKDYKSSLFCRDQKVVLFALPPHTSHVMQPLDKCFFGPFKSNWKIACNEFIHLNHTPIDKFTFGRVFKQAYDKTSSPELAIKCFDACGLWPVDENAINYTRMQPAAIFAASDDSTCTLSSTKAVNVRDCSPTHSQCTDPEAISDPCDLSLPNVDVLFPSTSIDVDNHFFSSLLQSQELDDLDLFVNDNNQSLPIESFSNEIIFLQSPPTSIKKIISTTDTFIDSSSDPVSTIAGSSQSSICSPVSQALSKLSPVRSKKVIVLEAIESTLSADEKALYKKKFEEKCEEGDEVYQAWLCVKKGTVKDEKKRRDNIREYCQAQTSSKMARRELFKVPCIKKNSKSTNKTQKKKLPVNLSSDEALEQLEQIVQNKGKVQEKKKQEKDKKASANLVKRKRNLTNYKNSQIKILAGHVCQSGKEVRLNRHG